MKIETYLLINDIYMFITIHIAVGEYYHVKPSERVHRERVAREKRQTEGESERRRDSKIMHVLTPSQVSFD